MADMILVVEDDDALRATMADALRAEGFEVREAADGRAALDALDSGLRPDLIVLDLMMPVMNGWEFRAAQLRDPDLSHIPVLVLVEAGAEEEAAERLSAVGALRCPCKPEQIVIAVRRHL
ncbi:response regulator [Azospirillum soli]|uniref:response regulator n=1 Tax=Azospirillum soli TaxID=1304799 RepID=UPI001AE645A3|nr:response regulator [Azospirillum soli]MBP2315784.1 CheY-like chemotaxis protein [Azospirillum soli]